MAGLFENLFPGAMGLYGYNEMSDKFDSQLAGLPGQISTIKNEVNANTNFTPWSVRSNMGNIQSDAEGMKYDLNSRGQGIQDNMFATGQGLLGRSAQDPSGRETDIYNRMRAVQQPEEERQQARMQNLAQAQGRGGLRSEMYGGTPEQLAFAKAQGENQNSAMLGAMSQAQSEAQNQYAMGSGMMSQGYLPMNQLLQQGQSGLNNAQLGQGYDMNRANLLAQLGLGEMGTQTNMSNIQQNALGNMVGAMSGMASGAGGTLDSVLNSYAGNQSSGLWKFIEQLTAAGA